MQMHPTSEVARRFAADARPVRRQGGPEAGERRKRRRSRAGRLVAALVAGGLVLSACSSHPSSATTTTTTTGQATPVAGGTAYFAEQPNSAAFYTFPLTPPNIGSLYTITQFQNLLWRPLYWFGNNGAPTMDPARSLAAPPTYLDGGRAVAIRLKAWHFSNGAPLTAGDVVFWLNLLKAEKDNWSAYVPGDFPDNVTSATVVNPRMLVLHLNGSYGANWFTDNELSQLIPLPAASWDRSGPSTRGSCSTTVVSSSGCAAVYRYLTHEAGLYASYATNPLWKVVDGPWEISAYQTDGYLELSPNPDYPGRKPHLAHLVEEPFTSPTAELNELLAGKVDYGYLPPEDFAVESRLAALGYRVVPTYSWSVNFIPINFNNPTVGVLFRQLYLRQAMQELVNQPGFITAAFHGAAAPDDGPVPLRPANPYVSSLERQNPYPYDPTAAAATLRAHGWSVRPGGTTSCTRPGSGPSDCGAGIAPGTPLQFSLDYYNGQPGLETEMTFLRSSFAQAGIALAIKGEPLPTLNASYFKCSPHQAGCTWQMVQGGLSWTFLPDYYPTSAEFLSSAGSSNSGSYASATADRLIAASHTGSLSALFAAEDYLAKDLPVLWLPVPATLTVVRDSLGGTEPNDPFFGLYASQWYFTK